MIPAFPDKAHPPTARDVARVLGARAALWAALIERLEVAHGPLRLEWKHYGKASGWTLKIFKGSRNLCFVSPKDGAFVVAFVFGDRAVAAVERSGLPTELVEALVTARKYAEGRGVRVEVQSPADVDHILTLTAVKLAS